MRDLYLWRIIHILVSVLSKQMKYVHLKTNCVFFSQMTEDNQLRRNVYGCVRLMMVCSISYLVFLVYYLNVLHVDSRNATTSTRTNASSEVAGAGTLM